MNIEKENQDAIHQIRFRLSRVAIFLSIIFSIFIIPTSCFLFVPEEFRGFLFTGLVFFYLLVAPKSECQISFTKKDIIWLLLIGYSFTSFIWADNDYAVIYGGFTSLLIYLIFKIFQSQKISDKFIFNFRAVIYIAFGIAILCAFCLLYNEFSDTRLKLKPGQIFGTNFNYISCVITVLFPLILFHNFGRFWIFKLPIVLTTLATVYLSNSAMAFLVVFGLVALKFIQLIAKTASVKRAMSVGFIIIILTVLYTFSNNSKLNKMSYVFKEITTQNDRLHLSKSTLKLVSKTPLLGFGQSNWFYRHGENGYNEFVHFMDQDTSFKRFHHAHNILIEKLSEFGILGSCILLLLVTFIFLHLFSRTDSFSNFEWQILYSLGAYFFCVMIYGVPYNASLQFTFMPVFVAALLGIIMNEYDSSNTIPYFSSLLMLTSVITLLFYSTHFYYKTKFNEGWSHFKQKEYNQSLIAFNNANILMDKSDINYWMGITNWMLKNKEDSVANLKKAVDKDPYSLTYLSKYAEFKAATDDCLSALKIVNKCNQLLERNLNSELTKIKCLFKFQQIDQFDSAVIDYRDELIAKDKVYKKYPDSNFHIMKSKRYLQKKNQLNKYLKSINQFERFEKE